MNQILYMILSVILFGILTVTIVAVDGNVTTVTHQTTFEKNTQESIVDLINIFDHDFSKIGHKKSKPKFKPGLLDSTSIAFYSDYNNDNLMDSISYYLGDVGSSNSPNPNIRYLYRRINTNNPIRVGRGIVQFSLAYFDSTNTQINQSQLNTTNGVNKIRAVKLQIRVESFYKYEKNFGSTFWEKTYRPISLNL